MSHNILCKVVGEFRRCKTVTRESKDDPSKKVEYRSFFYEDENGASVEVSVRDNELWEDVKLCRKGAYYRFPLHVVAGFYNNKSYDYVQLYDTPARVADDDGVILDDGEVL